MARKYFNSGISGRTFSTLFLAKSPTTEENLSLSVNDSPTCELNRAQLTDLRDQIDAFLAARPPRIPTPVMEGDL